jgi:hypothetical protein
MTATNPATLTCPACQSANTMLQADGDGLCFECRNVWNPAEVVALTPPPPVVAMPDTVDTILGPPDELRDEVDPVDEDAATTSDVLAAGGLVSFADALLAELVGGIARLEGGQRAVVAEVLDEDTLRVILGDGRSEVVTFADVESVTPASSADHDAETGELFRKPDTDVQAALLCAGLIIEAGVQTVQSAADGAVIGLPPTGWLPRDGDLVDVLEQACGLAVAMVIDVTGADPSTLALAADKLSEMTLEATKKGNPE